MQPYDKINIEYLLFSFKGRIYSDYQVNQNSFYLHSLPLQFYS